MDGGDDARIDDDVSADDPGGLEALPAPPTDDQYVNEIGYVIKNLRGVVVGINNGAKVILGARLCLCLRPLLAFSRLSLRVPPRSLHVLLIFDIMSEYCFCARPRDFATVSGRVSPKLFFAPSPPSLCRFVTLPDGFSFDSPRSVRFI